MHEKYAIVGKGEDSYFIEVTNIESDGYVTGYKLDTFGTVERVYLNSAWYDVQHITPRKTLSKAEQEIMRGITLDSLFGIVQSRGKLEVVQYHYSFRNPTKAQRIALLSLMTRGFLHREYDNVYDVTDAGLAYLQTSRQDMKRFVIQREINDIIRNSNTWGIERVYAPIDKRWIADYLNDWQSTDMNRVISEFTPMHNLRPWVYCEALAINAERDRRRDCKLSRESQLQELEQMLAALEIKES